ncbi:MAG: peptidylprolyl isomerase [Helicobacteraceae bacterium]|nr:peptidylprolyl isomerase [Helicobacteraceae bacterium]
MNKVKNNHLVSICYQVTDKSNGEILDSNNDRENPLTFLMGKNQVIEGLEKAIIDKEIGSKFNAEIEPKDAYGIRNPEFLQEIPKNQFSGIELIKGMTLYGQSEDGQNAQVIVKEIGEDSVIVDYNHPLAGKTLLFEVEIISSKEPSEQEILELTSHSCGCGHSGGGCCGGHHKEHSDGCGCHS